MQGDGRSTRVPSRPDGWLSARAIRHPQQRVIQMVVMSAKLARFGICLYPYIPILYYIGNEQ